MRYRIRFAKQAEKDVKQLSPKLQTKLKDILRNVIAIDPYQGKRLIGNLAGYYSIRLSFKDRIVYSIEEKELIVLIVRARTHYGD